ncbi:flagellar motor switch protein FliM [Nitratiruptor sp. YY08-26]|uniref:flagellar motor switch protein FliM n=1 Tax=unclassified Nitratiruptor TaxID=2624044 RepID=UPI00191684E6|nr:MULTISPECIES: FliM/FliN family flagellar motor switch protein [unclassified Nitratiruptor]BCD61846.1 flagellar motor switch protein FliM [Nitratiruptor sp. YY08-13]BCD65781.1 flagellar motor switch protein FliM [Nitratiruptor sp. YY08-26]
MSEQEFLSQEEIDALLGGDDVAEEPQEQSDIRPFDFSELESIKKGGLPGLELIYERWAKSFRDDIRKLLPKINMVSKESIYITRFNTFMFKIPMPSSYTTFTMKPLKETALLVVDSRLVFTIISVMFGGPAKPFKVEGREFTKLETYVIKDFIDLALKKLQETFSLVYNIEVEKRSTELNPALAKITSGNEKVIIAECLVDIDGYEAPIYFCYPQGMFLPIKDVIYSEFSGEVDTAWKEKLNELLLQTDVEVTLELAKKEYFLREIIGWEVGTELMLDVSKEDLVKLRIADKEKFVCRLGKVGDRYAALLKEEVSKEEENE